MKIKCKAGDNEALAEAIWKAQDKLAFTIPDMGEMEIGDHPCTVEISVNGQEYSESGVTFLYKAIDRNMSEEDLKKLEEEEAKAAGKKKKK